MNNGEVRWCIAEQGEPLYCCAHGMLNWIFQSTGVSYKTSDRTPSDNVPQAPQAEQKTCQHKTSKLEKPGIESREGEVPR